MKYYFKITKRLNDEYFFRKNKNDKYSKRAFARWLGLPSTYLLRLMKGEIPPTENLINRIADTLHFSAIEREQFILDLKENRAKIEELFVCDLKVSHCTSEEESVTKLLNDAPLITLIELGRLDSFVWDTSYIATKMNISEARAKEMMLACEQSGFIKDGKITINDYIAFSGKDSVKLAELMRARHIRLLEQIKNALVELPPSIRSTSSVTIAIDSSLCTEVSKKINIFRKEMIEYIERSSKKRDSVYDLSFAFIPLVFPNLPLKNNE